MVAAVSLVAGSRPAAEDAVQEALLRAWTKGETGEEFASLAAWIVTVALNLSRSGIRRAIAERKARHRVAALTPEASPGPDGEATDVERAVEALPRRQREVVVLRYLLNLDTRETADALRISEGTVKSSLAAARTALVKALGPDEREDVDGRAEHR